MALLKIAAIGAALYGAKKGLDASGIKLQDMYIKKEIKKLFENRDETFDSLLKKVESKPAPKLSEEYESKKTNVFLSIMDVQLKTKLHFGKDKTFRIKTTVWFKGLETEFKLKGRYENVGQRFTVFIDQEDGYKMLPEEYQQSFDVIIKEDQQSENTNDIAVYFNSNHKENKEPVLFKDSW